MVGEIEESLQPVAEHMSVELPEPDPIDAKQWRSELPRPDLTDMITDVSPIPFRSGGIADDFTATYLGVKVTARRVRHLWFGDYVVVSFSILATCFRC